MIRLPKFTLKIPQSLRLLSRLPQMQEDYNNLIQNITSNFKVKTQNPHSVYANKMVNLSEIHVYGFDYDYTLVRYTPALIKEIYNNSKQALVEQLNYPTGLYDIPFNIKFSTRGLHYDIVEGILMKIDGTHRIQLGTAYIGHRPVKDDDIIRIYGSTHIPISFMNDTYGNAPRHKRLVHFIDNFSSAEINLLTDVAEFFLSRNIPYDPVNLYTDVHDAVHEVHVKHQLHDAIINNVEKFIEKPSKITLLLERLKNAGKKTFLVTNSPFYFIDAGLKYLTGYPDWKDLFDLIIIDAGKPAFYTATRPFRLLEPNCKFKKWDTVSGFHPGNVYCQGNVTDLMKYSGWNGQEVIYIGDHMYSDLVDPVLKFGWRSGAIIPDLEREINRMNTKEYQMTLTTVLQLEQLIAKYTPLVNTTAEIQTVDFWEIELANEFKNLKENFNKQFGSLFRTIHGTSYFSRRLARFADLYTARVDNLLNYSLSERFYGRRISLPHEAALATIDYERII
ncbi:5'-nucleotidase domain-containing protein 3 [Oopsacas minuta]|uniref:5'-nucleotidase domain-containing protein 3 n=1 Tax=Oopsacas minuta TaxID=111878 RepID=A0AAV7JTN4_9METZ|nr:5'-nucleotidase domain-containing protein 3 [Oopsacas minuta]